MVEQEMPDRIENYKVLSPAFHEDVEMPNQQFAIKIFYYEREVPGGVFPLHWHEQIEFIYLQSGRMHITCNNRPFTARAGDLVVINNNEYHCCDMAEVPLSLYCVIVDLSILNSRFYDACEEKYIMPFSQNYIKFKNLIADDPEVTGNILKIIEENRYREAGYELAIKASLYSLFASLFRRHIAQILTQREHELLNKNLCRINTVIEHIEKNYMEELSVGKIADMLGINKFYFCRLFREYTGKTLTEYINSVRIRESAALLKGSDMSITEIAMRVGFNDVNYFSRIFRSHTGTTPSSMRKNIVNGKLREAKKQSFNIST